MDDRSVEERLAQSISLSLRSLDLAIEQLLIVKDEVPGMTDQKKAILYQLGTAYEQQGKMDFAIGEYKLLYGVDIAYRDVADKIDTFYSRQADADA